MKQGIDQCPFLPSPEQIQAACLEIRKNWTEQERQSRVSSGVIEFDIPVIHFISLPLNHDKVYHGETDEKV